jgi:hypothetical protein
MKIKRFIYATLLTVAMAFAANGQSKKVTEFTADTAPTSDDLVMTVNDPSGTAANKKATLANVFFAFAPWSYCSDAGSNDTYACSLSPAPAAYVTGNHYRFKANTVNTGAATVNFNAIGAKTIKKLHDQDLADGDIEAGQWVDLVYDGTNMQMQSQIATAASGGGSIAPLVVEDANTVAQRNSTTPQTFNFYSSFTNTSNYTRLRIGWGILGGTNLQFISEGAGTGSSQAIQFASNGGSIVWDGTRLSPSGLFTQDIGFPGANRFNRIDGKFFTASDYFGFDGGVVLRSTGTGSGNDNVLKIQGAFSAGGTFTGVSVTPGDIGADQNNYTPNCSYFQRWSSNASRNVTGLSIAGNQDGQTHVIVNVGSFDIVLKHQDTNSTAANRFISSTGADITLSANQAADTIYDGNTQRWRVFKRN